jgi:hypothetical protein
MEISFSTSEEVSITFEVWSQWKNQVNMAQKAQRTGKIVSSHSQKCISVSA